MVNTGDVLRPANGEDTLKAQFPELVPKLVRLTTALESFRSPENSREQITVWRQSTPQSGSFSVTINDDTISLKRAIEAFEDDCKPMDLKNIAVISHAGIEFVDFTDAKNSPDNRVLARGQLVILLAPGEARQQ